jgi:hypothetical protein
MDMERKGPTLRELAPAKALIRYLFPTSRPARPFNLSASACQQQDPSLAPPPCSTHLSPPAPVVCNVPLKFVNLVYSGQTFSIFSAFGPDFDGIGLLGDEFRDATGDGGHTAASPSPSPLEISQNNPQLVRVSPHIHGQ